MKAFLSALIALLIVLDQAVCLRLGEEDGPAGDPSATAPVAAQAQSGADKAITAVQKNVATATLAAASTPSNQTSVTRGAGGTEAEKETTIPEPAKSGVSSRTPANVSAAGEAQSKEDTPVTSSNEAQESTELLQWAQWAIALCSQTPYHMVMAPLSVFTVLLLLLAKPSTDGQTTDEAFAAFKYKYLIAWGLCVAGDWFQGPYVYALYAEYGFTQAHIAQLFVAGFGSSLLFGMFIGAAIDEYGRKKSCIAYCIVYMLSCLTKHSNSYGVLLVGRVLGGISTSLLNSAFECWLVSECNERHKFSEELRTYMFGMMFSVQYAAAIATGLIADFIKGYSSLAPWLTVSPGSHIYMGGSCVPFDLAIFVMFVGMLLIGFKWTENRGTTSSESEGILAILDSFRQGLWILTDMRIFCLCVVVTCFESSMFIFVYQWTPVLTSKTEQTPHGVIFACFMMASACGSSGTTMVKKYCSNLHLLLLCSFLSVATFFSSLYFVEGAAEDGTLRLLAFLAFVVYELCVGLYFPNIGDLKSEIVPEASRGVVYNLFRIPMNTVVLCVLLAKDGGPLPMKTCFQICTVLSALMFLALVGIKLTSEPTKGPEIAEAKEEGIESKDAD